MKTILALSLAAVTFGSCAAKKATQSTVEAAAALPIDRKFLEKDKFSCEGKGNLAPHIGTEFKAVLEKSDEGYDVTLKMTKTGYEKTFTYKAEVNDKQDLTIRTPGAGKRFILNFSKPQLFANFEQFDDSLSSKDFTCK